MQREDAFEPGASSQILRNQSADNLLGSSAPEGAVNEGISFTYYSRVVRVARN
jgi:hypothetical protein